MGFQRDAMEILRLNSPDKAPGADDVQSAMRLTQLLNAKNLLTTNEVVKDASLTEVHEIESYKD